LCKNGFKPEYANQDQAKTVRALVFDVFGTVVDWRSCIIQEGLRIAEEKGLQVNWNRFAHAWRLGYSKIIQQVRNGTQPWTGVDDLLRLILNDLLEQFNIHGLSKDEIDHFSLVWHRLQPWPDSVAGLTRLRKCYIIATLSNANISLLIDMAKKAALPWDCLFSAELCRRYKPDPEVYQMAASLLELPPDQIMMVASHWGDLVAAQRVGLKTAFVERPLEFGSEYIHEESESSADVRASDFIDLAQQLDA
jgi:2-haloacid dehalogenase